MIFLQQLINGITLGSLYALIALGYTMVYGVLLMINFAHSEVLMIGAFVGCLLLKLDWVVSMGPVLAVGFSFAVTMAVTGILALAIERLAYRPLRKSARLTPLISAIGVSLFLQNAAFLFISSENISFPMLFQIRTFYVGGATISSLQIMILIAAIFLMVLLHLFVNQTRLGTAIRATAQDAPTASLMGIPVNQVIALTFILGGALGGIAGALNGMYYGSIKYSMGFIPGIKAFTAAVLGGIGNIPGAMWGGFILGIVEALAAGFIPNGADWKDVIAFSILILVLLFRPQGLFGRHVPEKV